MPPRAHHRESASESEAKTGTTSRAANKARNAVAQAAQLELLSKHIHSNGPNDKPKVDPLDFVALDDGALTKYSSKYGLNLPPIESINENILQSEIGKKTSSAKKLKGAHRISKPEYASEVSKHFAAVPCRENEMIANFLYKVKNEKKTFKLTF
ncbi:Sin3 binding region of histone deacetylase complex subunit SAP30 family protein [Clavispora lusitaniae]|uniref:Sin3 binding region of histone deacetylase complex subunit SAP30 family protein n=1 Tax=Clavispora lusitaniae TaxID=36911 RepID=UPI00202CA17E|nr:Sin3 binding region of histone deacetylase complex subunit SAP30 family protein [Clavispora lusitaniae]